MQCRPPPTSEGCKRCRSDHQTQFLSKIVIHPLENLNDPATLKVWIFSKLSICRDCGHAEICFSNSRGITFQDNEGNAKSGDHNSREIC
jgi:hypothetical protein